MAWWALLVLQLAAPSGVEGLATEVARTLKPAGLEGPIGVYVEGPTSLAQATASLTLAQLAPLNLGPVLVEAPSAVEAETRARASGLRSLVRLTVSLEADKLVARGDAISTWVNFWSGKTPTRAGPAIALALSVEADSKVRLLTAPPSANRTPTFELSLWARLPARPAAVFIANHHVLALVGDELWVWTSEGQLTNRIALSGARSTHPTREPFGLLWQDGPRIGVWSSRFVQAEFFQVDSVPPWRALKAAPSGGLSVLHLVPQPGAPFFEATLQWGERTLRWPNALAQVATLGPTLFGVDANGSAAVSLGEAPSAFVFDVGSGSTLADFDGDGAPEIVLTSNQTHGDIDEVRVVTLSSFEAAAAKKSSMKEVPALWTYTFNRRAVVAASGTLVGEANPAAIFGTWAETGEGELWLMRTSP